MKLTVKAITLTVSHLAVFAIGAASVASYLIQHEFRIAAGDPLHQVGLALAVPRSESETHASIDADLARLQGRFRAPTVDVIRLVALLQQGRLDDAAKTCVTLAWAHCDAETLAEMREVSHP
jgi:hypothetical protein